MYPQIWKVILTILPVALIRWRSFLQRAYITISINPHYLTVEKILSLTLTIHSYIICLFFAIAYINYGVLYDCTSSFHRFFFTHKQLGQSELQNERNPFFQAEIAMGRNWHGPKLTLADFVVGRNDPEPLKRTIISRKSQQFSSGPV